MKRLALLLGLVFWAQLALAQEPVVNSEFSMSPSAVAHSGPSNPGYIDIRGKGVSSIALQWWEVDGTVSAGSCAVQGGTDNVTFGTTIIAAQDVTSSGGPTAIATGVTSNYIRVRCTTPIASADGGKVRFRLWGWPINNVGAVSLPSETDDGSVAEGQSGARTISLTYVKSGSEWIPATPVTNTCSGAAHSVKRYITTGSSANKSQVKATAGTLCSIVADNAHATTASFVKCTNATAANTTPGSTAVFFRLIIPALSPAGAANIDVPFDTALTCYVVTGKADSDATDTAADDVSYTITYQ